MSGRKRRSRAGPRASAAPLRALLAGTAALLLLAGGYLWLLGGSTPAPLGTPFRLTQADGRTVTARDFGGKDLLVYLGYTGCPDICPTTLAAVADAMGRLGSRGAALQPVFVTLDPAHDTPASAERYAAAFSPRILGLGGTQAQIDALARAYRISVAAHGTTLDHTAVLLLLSPDGSLITALPADETGTQLSERLQTLLPSRS